MELHILPRADSFGTDEHRGRFDIFDLLLEQQIENVKSAAVFVGAEGIGPWQDMELHALLNVFVQQNSPVIPVILPHAPSQPALPLFLKEMTWVDFRVADP